MEEFLKELAALTQKYKIVLVTDSVFGSTDLVVNKELDPNDYYVVDENGCYLQLNSTKTYFENIEKERIEKYGV